MSVSKFRFVSPGVFVNEIDNSQLPRTPAGIGPVVIGRSLRGPLMRPVIIQSFSDFVEVFGEPVPGGKVGDVWRDGNRLAPTYGSYAAQAYLRNSNPLTFVRLGGFQHDDKTSGGEAGWSHGDAYGLFVMDISQSSTNVYTTNGTASAALAAVIYSTEPVSLSGKPLSGAVDVTNVTGTWVRVEGASLKMRVHPAAGLTSSVDFDENSKNYIRNVLNTNPVATNGRTTIAANPEKYFLGETYYTWVKENLSNYGSSTDVAVIAVKLDTSTFSFSDFKQGATAAETGWVVSQHTDLSSSFTANATTGEYPVAELFKFVTLSEGEWNAKNLKICIEDIKESSNRFNPYGSFTVSIRKIDDKDNAPEYVERFANLNLDPSSDNFILKRIGDKYSAWDYEKKAFLEYGVYDNNSKFIRIELNPDLENGLLDPSLLPFGFYGPKQYTSNPVAGGNGNNVAALSVSYINTAVVGNNNYTASFLLPEVPLLANSTDSITPALGSLYWGLKTNVGTSRRYNKDLVDVVREKPASYAATKYSFMFSLDDVKLTGSANQNAAWAEGNRYAGTSLTALSASSTLTNAVLNRFNKFVMPLVGGSDGVNIKEKDPFCKSVLSSGDQYSNYAYNSVQVAIDSIADPEVVEMNLASIPGVENKGLTAQLIEKCETRGDALAVIDLEGDYDPENPRTKPIVNTVVENLKDRALNSSYGCTFFPWVLAQDTLSNNKVWLPPSIAALGTFSSAQRNTELWFAPAGFNRGGLSNGAAGLPILQTALRLSSKDRDALYEANINPIATFPAEGIVIFGQKTLQVTPSALDRINVRRLMIFLKKEISRFASTVLFDPNVSVTWARFTNVAEPFLQSVQTRFGLSEYRLILDGTTTTPDLVDRNIVYAKILLKPTRAIEFIALDFVITNTGASFND